MTPMTPHACMVLACLSDLHMHTPGCLSCQNAVQFTYRNMETIFEPYQTINSAFDLQWCGTPQLAAHLQHGGIALPCVSARAHRSACMHRRCDAAGASDGGTMIETIIQR